MTIRHGLLQNAWMVSKSCLFSESARKPLYQHVDQLNNSLTFAVIVTVEASSGGTVSNLSVLRPWPKDQTLIAKHQKFAYQAMFGHVTKHWLTSKYSSIRCKIFVKKSKSICYLTQKLLDEMRCFSAWPNGQTDVKQTMLNRLVRA